ncbi:MAG: DegT/DnrJ/EryC1/StrS family aminotransferase [Desulfomonile tiedjei]|uniref:GDP-perosamine synthase n=1 Tax=Desulfomonile tiedjei TaxID=2358 RepID=A0A9D6V814_9BACT|nr:DegT/DnrJ/EryC1/StrS family aminotransferase [Desulfomonile tiedjei]
MIPVCEPVLNGREMKYVTECLETNWISSAGKYISLFEEKFSKYCGMPFGVACTNCTTALHMSMVALGIGPGDEVIIPDFTLIVSANTVIQTGARPVLVDVDPKTWCIDAKLIEAKISPRTKAIMVVHMYGHPCDMETIMEIARRHNLFVIEDCAQAHGAEVNGRKAGSFGDVSCFSFYGNKILTTGEGGMVLCRDEKLAERLQLLRNQGFQEPRFVHEVVAYNYRMTNVQAAIGVAQTEMVEEKIAVKRWIGQTYNELLAKTPDLTLPYEEPWAKNVYWMYGVLVNEGFGLTKDELMIKLKQKGVDTRSFFCPMSQQPVFINGNDPSYPDVSVSSPVSQDLWNRGLYLPSGLGLTKAHMQEVAVKLLECHV